MSQAWVALLRGINVGGRRKVPMAGLRRAFEAAGCTDVHTYIQSGNVLFTSRVSNRSTLSKRLERTVTEAFDVPSAVILRTDKEVAKVARARPFGKDTTKLHVMFLASRPDRKAVQSVRQLDAGPDRFKLVGTEVYLHLPNGVGRARLTPAVLERHLGVAGTVRNWKTVTRLAQGL